jgi:hypothetical protein
LPDNCPDENLPAFFVGEIRIAVTVFPEHHRSAVLKFVDAGISDLRREVPGGDGDG